MPAFHLDSVSFSYTSAVEVISERPASCGSPRGWGARVWVAVLDEPTNHLDLSSIERLEEAMAEPQ